MKRPSLVTHDSSGISLSPRNVLNALNHRATLSDRGRLGYTSPFRGAVAGAIEAEAAQVTASSPGLKLELQERDDNSWSGGQNLWVRAKEKGRREVAWE